MAADIGELYDMATAFASSHTIVAVIQGVHGNREGLILGSKAAEKVDLDSKEVFLLPQAWLEPETTLVEPPRPKRGPLLLSWLLSLVLHGALLLLLGPSWLAISPEPGEGGAGSALFSVVFVERSGTPGSPDATSPAPEPAPPREPVVLPVKPPPAPVRPPRSPRVKRVVRAPKPPKTRARTIDGVRIARAEDIRAKLEREQAPPAPPVQPKPEVEQPVAPLAAPVPPLPVPAIPSLGDGGTPAARPDAEGAGTGTGVTGREAGSGDREPFETSSALSRLFGPDTPGYNGRIFAQISMPSSVARGNFYGRIHLFPNSGFYRDYSDQSLFGYSFRHQLSEVAFREFETGRVNTPGAYLMVTDLFPDGHYSTMSHTVLFTFPRSSPGGANLYDVVDEPDGGFRLRGPAGSYLVFAGGSGQLRRAKGFVVEPQGDIGTPPRIAYRGLHLRLEAVGSNPFLSGRPATVVDAAGRQCSLSTSDLFSYAGRRESDVFRFTSDQTFFKFLRAHCSGLDLPRPAETRVAKGDEKPAKSRRSGESAGLFQLLLPGSR